MKISLTRIQSFVYPAYQTRTAARLNVMILILSNRSAAPISISSIALIDDEDREYASPLEAALLFSSKKNYGDIELTDFRTTPFPINLNAYESQRICLRFYVLNERLKSLDHPDSISLEEFESLSPDLQKLFPAPTSPAVPLRTWTFQARVYTSRGSKKLEDCEANVYHPRSLLRADDEIFLP